MKLPPRSNRSRIDFLVWVNSNKPTGIRRHFAPHSAQARQIFEKTVSRTVRWTISETVKWMQLNYVSFGRSCDRCADSRSQSSSIGPDWKRKRSGLRCVPFDANDGWNAESSSSGNMRADENSDRRFRVHGTPKNPFERGKFRLREEEASLAINGGILGLRSLFRDAHIMTTRKIGPLALELVFVSSFLLIGTTGRLISLPGLSRQNFKGE